MDEESDIEAIKETLNQYAAGVNTGDFDRWISLWADDGVQMPPDTSSRVGKEQIREGMKPAFDQMNLDITIHSIEEAKIFGEVIVRDDLRRDVCTCAGDLDRPFCFHTGTSLGGVSRSAMTLLRFRLICSTATRMALLIAR